MKTRDWDPAGFDYPQPRKSFGALGIQASFEVNDCGHYLTETATVTSGMVYYEDQASQRLPLETIPETVFSEVMRDVDLFVSVAQTAEAWKKPQKLFLPFLADDDKRIAEIFSKILFLSRDDQITDPQILGQLDNASD